MARVHAGPAEVARVPRVLSAGPGAAGILCGWALYGYLVVGRCRDTLRLALQGYSAAGYCKDTWWLGAAGILGGKALQGCFAVGHCRDSLRWSTA